MVGFWGAFNFGMEATPIREPTGALTRSRCLDQFFRPVNHKILPVRFTFIESLLHCALPTNMIMGSFVRVTSIVPRREHPRSGGAEC